MDMIRVGSARLLAHRPLEQQNQEVYDNYKSSSPRILQLS